MQAMTLPAELPKGWIAEHSTTYGTIITAVNDEGEHLAYVTVAEDMRSFSLGISRPRRPQPGAEPTGRGWKKQLYQAAIAKLEETLR